MKEIFRHLQVSVKATIVLLALACGIYPLAVWGVSQVLFHEKANGSLVERDGKTVGSTLIAQAFRGARYFHPRPSAAGNGYDAASSGGSNLGPLSKKLLDAVRDRVEAYRTENGLPADAGVPADAVTSSGSGLDPQITVRNALLQLPRVAAARGLPEERARLLVEACTQGPDLGIFGEAGVNVLELNLALDGQRVQAARSTEANR